MNKINTQISVIVPIYNTGKYLTECLNGIVNQTFNDIEVILVNDGSTDNSLDICNRFKNNDIRITIVNQENSGVAVARNKGLEIAKGKYVIFLDSDDIFSLDLLEKLYNQAEKTNADITICRENAFNNVLKTKEKIKWYLDDSLIPKAEVFSVQTVSKYILNFCILWPWDKLYKREFLSKIEAKYPTDRIVEASEDLVFVGRTLANANKITIVNEYLIDHRYHSSSLEATRNKYSATESLHYLEQLLRKDIIYDKVEQSFINLVVSYLNWHYSIRKTDKQEVETIIKKAVAKYKLKEYPDDYFYDKYSYNCFCDTFLNLDQTHKVIKIFGIKISLKKKNKGN